MKTIQFTENLPAKINTQELTREIAARLKIEISQIGLSTCGGGTRKKTTGRLKTDEKGELVLDAGGRPQMEVFEIDEQIAPLIEVHLPDEVAPAGVDQAIRDHAPEMDDHEALTTRLAKEEEDKISNHPVVKRLQSEMEAIKNVPGIREHLAGAVEGNQPVDREIE